MVYFQRLPRGQVIQELLTHFGLAREGVNIVHDILRRLRRRLLLRGIQTKANYRVATTQRRLRHLRISFLMTTGHVLRHTTKFNRHEQIRGGGIVFAKVLIRRVTRRVGGVNLRSIRGVKTVIGHYVVLHRLRYLHASVGHNGTHDTTLNDVRHGKANINGTIRRVLTLNGLNGHLAIVLLIRRRTYLLTIFCVSHVFSTIFSGFNDRDT